MRERFSTPIPDKPYFFWGEDIAKKGLGVKRNVASGYFGLGKEPRLELVIDCYAGIRMKKKLMLLKLLAFFLAFLLVAPQAAMAQSEGADRTFKQEELDQLLAPIALYPKPEAHIENPCISNRL